MLDQTITVNTRAPSTLVAHRFTLSGSSDVGTLGLETDARRFDGSTGDTVIFAIPNANGARGAACRSPADSEFGWNCRVPRTIVSGPSQTLRLWRLLPDALGQWWGAWILDANGVETEIGALRVPLASTSVTSSFDAVEYVGPEVDCDAVPKSRVTFAKPGANRVGTSYSMVAAYDKARRGSCTGGTATPSASDVVVELGGPR